MQAPRISMPTPTRRRALAQLAAGTAALGLSGCGFALRQAPKFAFESVQVAGFENTSVSRSLQQALVSSGLRVVNSSAGARAPVDPAQAAVPPQVVPFALGHITTRALRRMASVRASCKSATSSLACAVSRLALMTEVKLGTASDSRMASTARVIINSIRLKPRAAR